MRTYKPVPWFMRKRNPRNYLKIERIESLSTGQVTDTSQKASLEGWLDDEPKATLPPDQTDPRYYYIALTEGFAVFERPKVDGTYRRSKVLAIYQTETTTRERVAIMNAIAEGRDRYEIIDGKVTDILLNKVVWSGQDSVDKAAELNAYERERIGDWR